MHTPANASVLRHGSQRHPTRTAKFSNCSPSHPANHHRKPTPAKERFRLGAGPLHTQSHLRHSFVGRSHLGTSRDHARHSPVHGFAWPTASDLRSAILRTGFRSIFSVSITPTSSIGSSKTGEIRALPTGIFCEPSHFLSLARELASDMIPAFAIAPRDGPTRCGDFPSASAVYKTQ